MKIKSIGAITMVEVLVDIFDMLKFKEFKLSRPPLTVGGGRCSKCNCKDFEGTTNTCANCGHSWDSHYGG